VDVLWSPWRYDYITGDKEKKPGCTFCNILESPAADEEKFILHRGRFNFVILNAYPYAVGHLMIVPFEHLDRPHVAAEDSTNEMMALVRKAAAGIERVYAPDGVNLGMNLGKAAGAGVAEHYHMHVLPRWVGDVNFITAIGETRVMSETLQQTFEKLRGEF
jgi:ATP adenylyltransferase